MKTIYILAIRFSSNKTKPFNQFYEFKSKRNRSKTIEEITDIFKNSEMTVEFATSEIKTKKRRKK
jgi:hypothetical protein